LTIRKAKPEELDKIMEIYRIAQDFMISTGNPNQWRHSHPVRELIENDIKNGICHLVVDKDEIHGVFALCEGKDPTYDVIEGAWLNDDPYITIHRIAGDRKVHGVFECAFDYCRSLISSVRIDTHKDNLVMQSVVKKHGFKECGIIYLLNGEPRIAYQWTESDI